MFNQSSYHAGNTNTTVNNNTLVPGAIDHSAEETFFVSFEWDSDIANRLMGSKPHYYIGGYERTNVQVIRMVTMLDRVVAELKIIEEKTC